MARKTREEKPKDEQIKSAEPPEEKVVFQVRFNSPLHAALKMAADECGTSLNQLIQDICQACVDHMHVGKIAKLQRQDFLALSYRQGCIFFGEKEVVWTEREMELEIMGDPEGNEPKDRPAKGWFGLNYSASAYVKY